MALSPFQQGQAFGLDIQQQRLANERTAALDEERRAGVTRANERQDTADARQQTEDAQADTDRERERAISVTRNVIGFIRKGIENEAPIDQIIQRVAPALTALKVTPEEIGQLPQMIAENPQLLDQLEAALPPLKGEKDPAERLFQTRVVDVPDPENPGQTRRVVRQTFSSGRTAIVDEGTPVAEAQAERRVAATEAGVDIRLSKEERTERKGITDDIKAINQVRSGYTLTKNAAGTVVRDTGRLLEIAAQSAEFSEEGDSFIDAVTRATFAGVVSSDEFEIQKLIDSVKGNVSIDSLLRIKQSGAGLGQVPQKQLELLARLLGELDIRRDPKLLLGDIRDIEQLYKDIITEIDNDIPKLDARELKLLRRRDRLERKAFGDEGTQPATGVPDVPATPAAAAPKTLQELLDEAAARGPQ